MSINALPRQQPPIQLSRSRLLPLFSDRQPAGVDAAFADNHSVRWNGAGTCRRNSIGAKPYGLMPLRFSPIVRPATWPWYEVSTRAVLALLTRIPASLFGRDQLRVGDNRWRHRVLLGHDNGSPVLAELSQNCYPEPRTCWALNTGEAGLRRRPARRHLFSRGRPTRLQGR